MLAGAHPHSGRQLVASNGSSGRAQRQPGGFPTDGPPHELLGVSEASTFLGVDPSYVKKVALATERNLDARPQLHGVRDDNGQWLFTRAELQRFAAARKEPKVVVAYDVTISFEKSISLAWARSTPTERATIEAALDAGTNAAVAYLEDQKH